MTSPSADGLAFLIGGRASLSKRVLIRSFESVCGEGDGVRRGGHAFE